MYVVQMGGAKLFGMRDGDVQEISHVLKDPDGRGEIKVASMQVQASDKFMLSTPSTRLELNDEETFKALEEFSLEFYVG